MTQTLDIPIQKLSVEAFRPYGTVVTPLPGPTTWSRPGLDAWTLDFALEGAPELKVVRYHYKAPAAGQEFSLLERHITVTETRVPLAGSRGVLIVAPATPIGRGPTRPSVADLRAFHLDGSQGVMLAKGTWHALDCYPIVAPFTDFLFITEAETEIEVEKFEDMALARRTEMKDMAADGIRFRITDPQQLCA
ncbi:MAG: ureidoglycolate lyase [Rhodospirillaceae bacterium]|nr:ureidoglycolate lyase [Rhodospirillaceae bacterium]